MFVRFWFYPMALWAYTHPSSNIFLLIRYPKRLPQAWTGTSALAHVPPLGTHLRGHPPVPREHGRDALRLDDRLTALDLPHSAHTTTRRTLPARAHAYVGVRVWMSGIAICTRAHCPTYNQANKRAGSQARRKAGRQCGIGWPWRSGDGGLLGHGSPGARAVDI